MFKKYVLLGAWALMSCCGRMSVAVAQEQAAMQQAPVVGLAEEEVVEVVGTGNVVLRSVAGCLMSACMLLCLWLPLVYGRSMVAYRRPVYYRTPYWYGSYSIWEWPFYGGYGYTFSVCW